MRCWIIVLLLLLSSNVTLQFLAAIFYMPMQVIGVNMPTVGQTEKNIQQAYGWEREKMIAKKFFFEDKFANSL